MHELFVQLYNMPADQLLVLLEALFLKVFYLWVTAMVFKILWKKANK